MLKNIVISLLLAIIAAGGIYLYFFHHPSAPVSLDSFTVAKPNLVITGKNLAKVELWGVPTGTNVSADQYQLLGNATLAKTNAGEQEWIFPIPQQPMLLAQIYAKGYGLNNAPSGQIDLPYVGATALYDALWDGSTAQATSTDLTLSPGQTGHFGSLAVTFNHVIQDSRCPMDVECIQAGSVSVNITFTSPGHTETKNISSHDAPQTFDEYKISITTVAPARYSKQDIAPGNYRITFHVENTAQR